jgi:uncharacterized membrane protein
MPTRFRRTMRRLQPYLDRIEPFTIFCTYMMIAWCAYFAWFSPPSSVRSVMGSSEQIIQAILFSVGAVAGMYGHLSDRLFPEEIGIIFSVFAMGLYVNTLTTYVIKNDTFWQNGQVFGVLVIAVLLLTHRGAQIQRLLSSKWLRPDIAKYYYKDEPRV